MADSVDRVFQHAIITVRNIPKTGASRPPPTDRLRLYAFFKQAKEGDVIGERPTDTPDQEGDIREALEGEELKKEQDKWDAWNAQKGVYRTEAKKRYIDALLEALHQYGSTNDDSRALVAELEFLWNQIKDNSNSSGESSPGAAANPDFRDDTPLKVLKPMSEEDEAERASQQRSGDANDQEDGNDGKQNKKTRRWRRNIENAMVRMSAEVAALREQITTGREYQARRSRSLWNWVGWLLWVVVKHVVVDIVVLMLLLLWLRRRKDRRVEDLVRGMLRIGREYVRRVVPPR